MGVREPEVKQSPNSGTSLKYLFPVHSLVLSILPTSNCHFKIRKVQHSPGIKTTTIFQTQVISKKGGKYVI